VTVFFVPGSGPLPDVILSRLRWRNEVESQTGGRLFLVLGGGELTCPTKGPHTLEGTPPTAGFNHISAGGVCGRFTETRSFKSMLGGYWRACMRNWRMRERQEIRQRESSGHQPAGEDIHI
jgi:hypothetical protein